VKFGILKSCAIRCVTLFPATVVQAAAIHYWVQTPYRYFPIEPHLVFPLFQFLPLRAKVAVAERWAPGNYTKYKDDRGEMVRHMLDIELLTTTELI